MELQETVRRGLLYTLLISVNGHLLYSLAQYHTRVLILVQFINLIHIYPVSHMLIYVWVGMCVP